MISDYHSIVQSGNQSFAYWLGRPEFDTVGLAEQKDDSLLGRPKTTLCQPEDENVRGLSDALLRASTDDLFHALASDLHVTPAPFWPDGAPYAVCLTHDVDRIRQASYHRVMAGHGKKGKVGAIKVLFHRLSREQDPFFNFDRLRQYETDWNVRSAIYPLFEKRRCGRALLKGEIQHVLGVYDPFDVREQLCRFQADGWEIGLHGSLDAHKSQSALMNEMTKLRQLLHDPNVAFGIRNHYLQFNWHITPGIQLACHALYDSTMGFNFTCGFRCGTTFPFVIHDSNGKSLIELPISVMDTALKFSVPGREIDVADRIADEVRKQGGLLMVNWHQRFCNRDTNPLMYNWVEKIITRARADKAWIALPCDVARRWRERIEKVVIT